MVWTPLASALLEAVNLPSALSYRSASFITSLIISTWIYEVQTLLSIYLHRFLIQNALKQNLSPPHLYAVGRAEVAPDCVLKAQLTECQGLKFF